MGHQADRAAAASPITRWLVLLDKTTATCCDTHLA